MTSISIDYDKLQLDIKEYLSKLDDWKDIEKAIPSSTLEMIMHILGGYSTYVQYIVQQFRKETYVSTATLSTSIYKLAENFGYNIDRMVAPEIQLRYNNVETRGIKYGDIIGSYNDYQILYTGPNKLIEKNDIINCSIGLFKTKNISIKEDLVKLELKPEELSSINNKIVGYINDVRHDISRDIEDYIIYKDIIEFSSSITETNIYIKDKKAFFGMFNFPEATKLDLCYLETDGYLDNIDISKIQLNEDYIYLRLSHNGYSGDTLEKIKQISPYYYQTMRRAVTNKDHKFLLNKHYLFKDISIDRDKGIPEQFELAITNDNLDQYVITISDQTYTFLNSNTLLEDIYTVLSGKSFFDLKLYDDKILMTRTDARVVPDITVSTGLNLNRVTENIKPLCCTLLCYYIKYNVQNDPISLTISEQQEIVEYMKHYKMAGTSIIYIPAEKQEVNIQLEVKYNGNRDNVYDQIVSILNDYELQLSKDFSYGEFLARVGSVEGITYLKPINLQDISIDGTKYLKFNKNITMLEDINA